MAAMFLASLILCAVQWQGGQSAEGASLPYPSMAITHSAKLLKLECRVPPQSYGWSQIFDVRLFKHPDFRDPTRNVSLVNMTSSMTQPKMANLPADSNVTFTGSWDKAVSLTLTMPLSEAERGRYYCTAEHKVPGGVSVYSTELVVDEESVQSGRSAGEGPFVFSVSTVDRVHMTWLNPDSAHDFTEASVSRTEMDRSGKPLTAATTLYFTVPGVRDFVPTGDVLLHKMSDTGGNSSVTLYVDPARCSARCQYGCRVTFRDCVGSDARHCVCGQAEEAESAGVNVFAVLFGVVCVVLVGVVVVVACLLKNKRCKWTLSRAKPPSDQPRAKPDANGGGDGGGLPANGGDHTSSVEHQTGLSGELSGGNEENYFPLRVTLPPPTTKPDKDSATTPDTETASRNRSRETGSTEEQQRLLENEDSEDVGLSESKAGQIAEGGAGIKTTETSGHDTVSAGDTGSETPRTNENITAAADEFDHSSEPARNYGGARPKVPSASKNSVQDLNDVVTIFPHQTLSATTDNSVSRAEQAVFDNTNRY